MSRVFVVTVPDEVALGVVFDAVLEALEPGASRHTLMTHMDERMRLTVKHSRLGVTLKDETP